MSRARPASDVRWPEVVSTDRECGRLTPACGPGGTQCFPVTNSAAEVQALGYGRAMPSPFNRVITTEAELWGIYRAPGEVV